MTEHPQIKELDDGHNGFFSREAVRSVPWMIFGKLILFFVFFGVSVLTVNGLGKEKFGIFSLLSNIASYLLVVCGLGMGSALMRYIPELANHRNHRGLIHLLWKSAALQFMATCGVTGVLFYYAGSLQRLFHAEHLLHFRFYLMLACGLVGLLLLKDFVATVYTALFKTRMVALLAIIQGMIWLVVLAIWLVHRPEVSTALAVQLFSLGLVYSIGAVLLINHVRGLPWEKLSYGIGKRRTLKFSSTAMLSAILRTVMFKYSEIFFLAAAGGATVAGIYDLGYSLPFIIVTFIPLALLPIFTSAFAEAYVKEPSCLGRLISSYYKVLIMVSLPVAILGSFFAPAAYHIIYKGEMDDAGHLASAFCIVLCLPLLSMPLSMALKAKEKVHNMIPMMLLQIIVNLFLDWFLIIHLGWGVWGGVCAVLFTFILTIYPRLLVVCRILGGIHFPGAFFLRICGVLVLEGAAFRWGVDSSGLLIKYSVNWINLGFLFGIAGLFILIFLMLTRIFGLIKSSDVADFRALEIRKLNTLINLLIR
jgi:O-antigen/teichoic acid export membrane protein